MPLNIIGLIGQKNMEWVNMALGHLSTQTTNNGQPLGTAHSLQPELHYNQF